jgi:ubiquinone biosynthesis accessory factor UbiK
MRAKTKRLFNINYIDLYESCSRSTMEHEITCLHQIGELALRRALGYQAVMSDNSIEDLARKLAEALPESFRSMRQDIEDNFRSVLKSGLGKLDLVTREEFEVQEAVLARTREKLEALEARLKELEEKKGSDPFS